MATKLSDAEIKALVNQNILKPAALAATAAASGVTLADLSRAAGVSADKLGSYFADAKVDTSALATKITSDEAAELGANIRIQCCRRIRSCEEVG
jgi:lambda repressor-like predicted transcriptional regulator